MKSGCVRVAEMRNRPQTERATRGPVRIRSDRPSEDLLSRARFQLPATSRSAVTGDPAKRDRNRAVQPGPLNARTADPGRRRPVAAPPADAAASAWECRIGGRVVGRVGLRRDARGTVSVCLFQIDPEWQHTAVAQKLMQCIRDYTAIHGCAAIVWEPGAAPGWVQQLFARR
jgi:hypothetical protein